MPPDKIAVPLQTAVLEYFAGEGHESLLIVAVSVSIAIPALWLWLETRSAFSAAFAATVLAAALLLSATAVSLLVRDKGLSSELVRGISSPQQVSLVQAERERIDVVISKYKYYRYGAAMLAVIGLLALLLSDRPWLHAVAAALLLLVVAQVLIDHYSEHRASVYFAKLSEVIDTPPE